MAKICFILVAGLDQHLIKNTAGLATLASFEHSMPLRPVTPAVTCTMQATLTTGTLPAEHGIIANGLYTHNREELQQHLDLSSFPLFRREVSFWEQSNKLLQRRRFWARGGKRVAMLFWQNSMDGAADVVVTPKPTHTADGKTLTACWSNPPSLYDELAAKLGPFPLHKYWGPIAGIESSQWIINATKEIWQRDLADTVFVYVPHLDYNLQRRGPADPAIAADLQQVDVLLGELIETVRSTGGIPIIAGDYRITPVTHAILPNVAFRHAGLLTTRPDADGKLLVDHANTQAFAMADHQIAHVYVQPGQEPRVIEEIAKLEGVARVLATAAEKNSLGLHSDRSGQIILLAKPDAWFAHDWWFDDAERPAWQWSVDIHRKPGYDPRELFFDPVNKRIPQQTALVRGSHGIVSDHPADWPVLLCDRAVKPSGDSIDATDVAAWLHHLQK